MTNFLLYTRLIQYHSPSYTASPDTDSRPQIVTVQPLHRYDVKIPTTIHTMPYIIYVPAIPRPYITNDPRIYVDCNKVFGWTCESRPFSDSYCKNVRINEDMRNEGDRRRQQLEQYWVAELGRQEMLKHEAEAALVKSLDDVEEPAPIEHPASTNLVQMSKKHDKRVRYSVCLSRFRRVQPWLSSRTSA